MLTSTIEESLTYRQIKEKGLKEGIQEGIKEGIKEGRVAGTRETILRMLVRRLKVEVPGELVQRIEVCRSIGSIGWLRICWILRCWLIYLLG